jgi:hypothetical protein
MKFSDIDDKAVAWYKSLPLWTAAAVSFGVGFVTCAFLGVVF